MSMFCFYINLDYWGSHLLVSMGENTLRAKSAISFVEILTLGSLVVVIHARLRLTHHLVGVDTLLLVVGLDVRGILGKRLHQLILHLLCSSVPSLRERSDICRSMGNPPLIEQGLLFCQYRQSEVLYLVFSID